MENLKTLSEKEKDLLLKFPAYISLLAANSDGEMDEVEKKEAIRLTHIKTYKCDPLLAVFYKEVEKKFEKDVDDLNHSLPKGKVERKEEIGLQLAKLEKILNKLGGDFGAAMHQSMKTYSAHVAKSHRSLAVSFLIPFYIKGLND